MAETIKNKHNERVCNICQEDTISKTNQKGICTMCQENRERDGYCIKCEHENTPTCNSENCISSKVLNEAKI